MRDEQGLAEFMKIEFAIDEMRELIQQDVGNRGLRTDPDDNLVTVCSEDLADACVSIHCARDAAVAVITGFYIPHAMPPCGETDGPLGAVFLARALVPLGIKVVLATDAFCLRALEAGLGAAGLRKAVPVVVLPSVEAAGTMSVSDYWQHFADRAGRLTHLIALERVGPSHTPQSVRDQPGNPPGVLDAFSRDVPPGDHDRCHTMRGRDITDNTSPAHRLFEAAPTRSPRVVTIGIGDGGNEIGMGKIAWDVIRRNIPGGAKVACRVATEFLIVCGVSNWGAYALGAGVRLLRGQKGDADLFDAEAERQLLELMVERGPLVDGVTAVSKPTVDGLSWEEYGAPLARLGQLVAGGKGDET